MDGIAELLEEYNFEDLDEMEDEGEIPADEVQAHSEEETNHQAAEKKEATPKKHFFKRIRK